MVNKSIKTILLPTSLDKNCWPAFEMAVSIASHYKATLVLLHVLEEMPNYVSIRLKDLLGEKQLTELRDRRAKTVYEALIGKKSTIMQAEEGMEQLCISAGIDEASCGYHSKEIVVVDGVIVEEILAHVKKYNADLVVMGSRKGFLSDSRIGHRIKSVMRQCHIPIMVVPADIEMKVPWSET